MDLFLEKSYAQSNNITNQCVNQYVVTSARTVYLQYKKINNKVNVMKITSNHWKWNFSEQFHGYITTNHELGGGGGGLDNVVVDFLKILPPKTLSIIPRILYKVSMRQKYISYSKAIVSLKFRYNVKEKKS